MKIEVHYDEIANAEVVYKTNEVEHNKFLDTYFGVYDSEE